jgi:hypothetical protein
MQKYIEREGGFNFDLSGAGSPVSDDINTNLPGYLDIQREAKK